MTLRRPVGIFVLSLLSCSIPVSAEDSRFAAAVNGSTLGPGLDVYYAFNPQWNGRLGFTIQSVSDGGPDRSTSVNYTATALVDWLPPRAKGFHLSGGLGLLETERRIYPQRESGRSAAYAGVGWGNPFHRESRWRFLVDAGVYWRFGPISTTLESDPQDSSRVAPLDAPSVLQPDTSSRFVPRLSIGASYHF